MELLAFTYSAAAYEDTVTPIACDTMALLGAFPLKQSLLTGLLSAITLASALGLNQSAAIAALQAGDVGNEVEALQAALLSRNYYDGEVTGYYGTLTQFAVAAFQRDRGLVADGVAGADTLVALSLDPDLTVSGRNGGGGGGGGPPPTLGTPGTSAESTNLPATAAGRTLQPAVVQTPSRIGLNVRQTPAGTRVDGEPDGTTVLYRPASATFVRDAALGAYTWVQIANGNWMARDYLFDSISSGPGENTAVYRVSASRGASIYDRPNGQVIGEIPPGQTVTLSQDDVFNGGQFWGELTGNRGWVAKTNLTLVATAGGSSGGGGGNRQVVRVAVSALVVRDAPSGSDTGHTLYGGQLVQTTGVTTLAAGRSWTQLLDGTWVASEYVEPV